MGLFWRIGRDLFINVLYSGGAYSLKEIREGLFCNCFWDGKGLIEILENIRATLKMGRGLSGVIYMVQGFICEYVCIVEGLIL